MISDLTLVSFFECVRNHFFTTILFLQINTEVQMNHQETILTVYNEMKAEEKIIREQLANLLKKIKPFEKYLVEVGVITKKTRSKKNTEPLKPLSE